MFLPLLYTLPTLALASPSLLPRATTCPKTTLHTPTVPEWQWALTTYCTRHTPLTITPSTPLTYTYLLTAYDGQPIKWLFKVWIDSNTRANPGLGQAEGTTPYTYQLSAQVCEEKFQLMVTGEKTPNAVCEFGGNRLFRGGNYREVVEKGYVGQVVWETRQVRGD